MGRLKRGMGRLKRGMGRLKRLMGGEKRGMGTCMSRQALRVRIQTSLKNHKCATYAKELPTLSSPQKILYLEPTRTGFMLPSGNLTPVLLVKKCRTSCGEGKCYLLCVIDFVHLKYRNYVESHSNRTPPPSPSNQEFV
jgi:hypothetical protein